jgi:hypothetical protein
MRDSSLLPCERVSSKCGRGSPPPTRIRERSTRTSNASSLKAKSPSGVEFQIDPFEKTTTEILLRFNVRCWRTSAVTRGLDEWQKWVKPGHPGPLPGMSAFTKTGHSRCGKRTLAAQRLECAPFLPFRTPVRWVRSPPEAVVPDDRTSLASPDVIVARPDEPDLLVEPIRLHAKLKVEVVEGRDQLRSTHAATIAIEPDLSTDCRVGEADIIRRVAT